ncbi:MAG: ABC transporter permease [Candidatus Hydrothermarchaeota archaeon]
MKLNRRYLLRIGSLLIFFFLWEVFCDLGLVSSLFLPAPSKVLLTFITLIMNGELITHVKVSLYRALSGFFIAAIIAIPHGILIALSRTVEDISNPIVELFRPIPAAALIPVAILWLGIENASKILIIAFACYFPILLNTISGVRHVDLNLVNVAKLFEASRLQIVTKIILPSATPFIITGLRLSLAVSLILLIVTEMIGARAGLGFLILDAEYAFQTEKMFAGIFTIGMIGFIFNEIMLAIERRTTRWRREIRV